MDLAEIQGAVNVADKLKILNATLDKSWRSQTLITIDNAAAGELIETTAIKRHWVFALAGEREK
ncbi:hypothetical protein [Azovibrio restrictus]|uniref:hypothetical protein n=1 Tax=Azovibrio restrictus TaxID=146938 RepID=UPI00146FC619|nr:hypothetical protein [Azovibrio restrictus]